MGYHACKNLQEELLAFYGLLDDNEPTFFNTLLGVRVKPALRVDRALSVLLGRGSTVSRSSTTPSKNDLQPGRETAITLICRPGAVSASNPVKYGRQKLRTDHPIDHHPLAVVNCYLERSGLINTGGPATGESDLKEAVRTAVVRQARRRHGG